MMILETHELFTYPITGPRKMPVKKMDITKPLLARATWSAILPPPMFIGPAPKLPAMNRNTMKEAILGARALPIEKPSVTRLEILKSKRRPYSSDSGDSKIGPNANPKTKIDTTRDVTGRRVS